MHSLVTIQRITGGEWPAETSLEVHVTRAIWPLKFEFKTLNYIT